MVRQRLMDKPIVIEPKPEQRPARTRIARKDITRGDGGSCIVTWDCGNGMLRFACPDIHAARNLAAVLDDPGVRLID